MNAPLARLWVVTARKGARFVKRQSMNSEEVAHLPRLSLFHGDIAGAWVRRLPSEGGGYAFFAAVREVE